MTHKEIEEEDIIERYALNRLSPEKRLAFQEHFFECDQCFEDAQMASRFIAGVRAASRSGVLAVSNPSTSAPFLTIWLRPAFVLSVAASVLLAVTLAWVWFDRVAGLREEIARERQAREQIEQEGRASLNEAQEKLNKEREERARLQASLDEAERQKSLPPPAVVQPNLPLVTLESTRDSGSEENRLVIPSQAETAVLWIAVEQGRYNTFRVQILTKQNRAVAVINGAKPNQYGALAVMVPSGRLQSLQYIVRLYGVKGRQSSLLGEYDLRVVRR